VPELTPDELKEMLEKLEEVCRQAQELQPTITGSSVLLKWCCQACSAEWPIVKDDELLEPERRTGQDRRHTTRTERRRKE
jgi:hypothetical protein